MTYEAPNDHPIFNACLTGDAKSVKSHLASGVNPYANGVISAAIRGGYPEVIQVFLDHGFDLSKPINIHGETPIYRTIGKKQMAILKFILENGSDANSNPSGLGTPLHGAAASWPEAIPVLLHAGADVHATTKDGRTPMMAAAFGNKLKSLELLLAAGGNLEDADLEGTTPLILAAKAGNAESIEWLLDHGANILAEDGRGKTAEDWAKANGHPKIVEMLQSRMGS